MGSTNRTTNYELSQFVGNDKPSWLSDYNGDMAKIDTAIKARSVEAGAAQTTADTANGKADALETRMGTAENNITALQNASITNHTQIATNTANISKNAQDIVQLDAKIGHTQITIGDHTVTGAIATLAQSQGTADADNVTYDNTTSGLTATNVQAAIDEVAGEIPETASDVTYDNAQSGLTAANVQAAIDEVEAKIQALPSLSKWTLAGSVSKTGTTGTETATITVPTTAKEILIEILVSNTVLASTYAVLENTDDNIQVSASDTVNGTAITRYVYGNLTLSTGVLSATIVVAGSSFTLTTRLFYK